MSIDLKVRAVKERIKNLEDSLVKAYEYLDNGSHAHWHGFRPWVFKKIRNGKVAPPHKDWIKNVFIPRHEKAIHKAEKKLEKLR